MERQTRIDKNKKVKKARQGLEDLEQKKRGAGSTGEEKKSPRRRGVRSTQK